jgi:glycosyltransferase involved in cell wall biosynthesis
MDIDLQYLAQGGVSVVIPCFGSAATLAGVVIDTRDTFIELEIPRYEILLVIDDASKETLRVAKTIQEESPEVKVIELTRNYGQHAAIFAGLEESQYEYIVTMDDDGQHLGSSIPQILEPLRGNIDVVYGIPLADEHNWLRNSSSKFAKYITFKFLKIENARDISSLRAFKRIAIEGIDFRSLNSAVVDVVLNWNTSHFTSVHVNMSKRENGKSNYSYYKLIKFAIQMITGYSMRPLRIATFLGLLTFVISISLGLTLLVQGLKGEITVPGYTSLSIFILFLGSMQLLTLGIIGEYLGRIHESSMGKPLYSIRREIDQNINLLEK